MQNTIQNPAPTGNFIKSLIKIANPDWTPEQIEAEAQKKKVEMTSESKDHNCEYCSS